MNIVYNVKHYCWAMLLAVACTGCHEAPKADQLTYSADQVKQVETALTDYDWSDFEP